MENSSNYFYPRLNISNRNKEPAILEGSDVFGEKNLINRSFIECDNPEFRIVVSDEQVMCNFFETGNQKFAGDVEIYNASDLHYQEIIDSNNSQQKTILNENNLEEDVHIDHSNYDFDLKKGNTERDTKRKSKNTNRKSNLSRKRERTKLQKTSIRNNKSQLRADIYCGREVKRDISCKLGSMNSMVVVLGSSIRKNSKIPCISNYGQLYNSEKQRSKDENPKSSLSKKCGKSKAKRATKRRSENANHKSNFDKKCDLAKPQKTYIGYDKSQLHIDNYMTFELKGDSSCKLESTNDF